MTTYRVVVSGCDDATEVDIDLDDAEAATVTRLAEAIAAKSEFGCQPTMRIRVAPLTEEDL